MRFFRGQAREVAVEKRRIAILCPGYGLVARGVETYIQELAVRLAETHPGWSFDIYSRARSRMVNEKIRILHVPAVDRHRAVAALYAKVGHRLHLFLRTRIDAECLSFTLGVSPRMLFGRYDLVFNQAGPFAGSLLRMKRRISGTPFVHKTASGFGRLELIMAKQHPDAVLATSPYAGEWLRDSVPDVRIECVPNAVDRTLFRPYSAKEMECPEADRLLALPRPVVLFVGAMDGMKRPELLIDAVAKTPASLVMVGDGIIADSIRRRGESALSKRFMYVPHVPQEKLPVYYNACDLFTLPSEEPFGIVFLEAMACNKPALSQKSPVQEWIFADAGATCECTNSAEYAATIMRMLEVDWDKRPLRRSQDFDWPTIAEKCAEVFSEVMG